MNTYRITWFDSGNVISRNSVVEDPKPTVVSADSFELYGTPPHALAFFKADSEEGFLFINAAPLMITRDGA